MTAQESLPQGKGAYSASFPGERCSSAPQFAELYIFCTIPLNSYQFLPLFSRAISHILDKTGLVFVTK